jgi:hypothetical protein
VKDSSFALVETDNQKIFQAIQSRLSGERRI